MADKGAATNCWVILIGINFYWKRENRLEGAVRDVEHIKKFLETESTPVNAHTFTASTPTDPNARHPTEDPSLWPTFETVTNSFSTVASEAKPGDFVYIHYSGHGVKLPDSSADSNSHTQDVGLVLFDADRGARYLPGLVLAQHLNEMVKRGLVVTITLDCCFSGRVVRDSDSSGVRVRAIDYDPAIDVTYPPSALTRATPQVEPYPVRDGHLLPDWLVDPQGYTIITACAPHEEAYELRLEGGKKNGALSHFLLRALSQLRRERRQTTSQSLHRQVCLRFRQNWPQQNPMRYGNESLSFFGQLRPADTAFVLAREMDRCLYLEAGHAHGVCQDDEYAVYPFWSSDDVFKETAQASRIVQVKDVGSFSSGLEEIERKGSEGQSNHSWKARLLRPSGRSKISVRLLLSVDDGSQWIAVAKERRYLHLLTEADEAQPCQFNVTCNNANDYMIVDASSREIPSVPTVQAGQEGALNSVLAILEHLAIFKRIEAIGNGTSTTSFTNSFRLHLRDHHGKELEARVSTDVNDGDILSLKIENLLDRPLYMTILDLRPSWQISSMISDGGGGDYEVIPAKGNPMEPSEQRWRMEVPESFKKEGLKQCEDVIKVIITSRPTSFAPLVLSRIPISVPNINRSTSHLSQLSATPVRGAGDGILDGEWAAWNFNIRTHYNGDQA